MSGNSYEHVHQNADNKWYFWDETEAEEYGPFETEQEARIAFDKYCWVLNLPCELANIRQLTLDLSREAFSKMPSVKVEVVCDETNNTPEDIKNQLLHIDVTIIPQVIELSFTV